VRNNAAGSLARLGVEAHRGDLKDTESLAAGARACEGVIHTAFIHDFSQFQTNAESDLGGSGGPFVVTSGTAGITPGCPGRPKKMRAIFAPSQRRIPSEEAALAMASRGVRASVVRVPPAVHGDGRSRASFRVSSRSRVKRAFRRMGCPPLSGKQGGAMNHATFFAVTDRCSPDCKSDRYGCARQDARGPLEMSRQQSMLSTYAHYP